MRFKQLGLEKYDVNHENGHFCGRIEWNSVWSIFQFIPANCGLCEGDCKNIYKFIKKLNKKYK